MISVVLKDRAGGELARLERPYVPLVGWADRAEYPVLGHVDPYGYTMCNRGQMQTLVVELERVRRDMSPRDETTSTTIDELQQMCAEGLSRPHRYLWFLGD
jgi:hypothetical protein